MITCTLKLPLSLHDNDNDCDDDDGDDDDIYTPPSDYNVSTYGTLSYPGHSEYEIEVDDDDEFDDVDPDFEDDLDTAPPKGIYHFVF